MILFDLFLLSFLSLSLFWYMSWDRYMLGLVGIEMITSQISLAAYQVVPLRPLKSSIPLPLSPEVLFLSMSVLVQPPYFL